MLVSSYILLLGISKKCPTYKLGFVIFFAFSHKSHFRNIACVSERACVQWPSANTLLRQQRLTWQREIHLSELHSFKTLPVRFWEWKPEFTQLGILYNKKKISLLRIDQYFYH